MKYELIAEKDNGKRTVRTYRNSATGTEVKTSHIYTDKEGQRWFGFQDLYKIPVIRTALARHIMDLYSVGLTLKDIKTWCDQEKALINSDDPEKLQKLYALILEKERLATYTADPIKQHLALATVYVMTEDERIDYFDESESEAKLIRWKGDMDAIAFFLTWHNEHIQNFTGRLNKLSETVLKAERLEKKTRDLLTP